jgi:hypothetical protein
MKTFFQTRWLSAALVFVAFQIQAQQLITNGGFESGFSGWTRADQVGSESTWLLQTGTASPVNGFTVPAPPEAVTAAMTDAQGPGTHVLYQDFTVPLTMNVATFQFDLYINNHASAFFSPNTLDFSTPTLNQQFRVDIITTSADPFSVSVGDVLMNLYQTQPGNPLVSGYLTIGADLTSLFASHLGQTLRLRFAEVDNVNFFNAGIDRVSITIPEPGSAALAVAGLTLFTAEFIRRGRRRKL